MRYGPSSLSRRRCLLLLLLAPTQPTVEARQVINSGWLWGKEEGASSKKRSPPGRCSTSLCRAAKASFSLPRLKGENALMIAALT